MQHVVMFSGGITSWAVARRVADEHGTAELTLLFADTLVEDADLYRFNDDVARDIGVPITVVRDGRTPWQVFRDKRFIGNARQANCSHLLKQVPCRKWIESNMDPDDTTIYLGIDWTETHRLPAIKRNYVPWAVRTPLCHPPYLNKDNWIELARARGLEPPALYGKGFAHNNCGGACVRAGQGQWARLLAVDPDRYAAEEREEAELRAYLDKDVSVLRDRRGGTVKTLTLTVLRERIEAKQAIDRDDIGGCGCFVDDPAPAA